MSRRTKPPIDILCAASAAPQAALGVRSRWPTALAAICGIWVARAVAQAPSNDVCVNAVPLTEGVNPGAPLGTSGSTYSTVGATSSSFAGGCGSSFASDVFFSYVAPVSGPTIVSLCTPAGFAGASHSDAAMAIYASAACPAGGPMIVCDDDTCGLNPQVTFAATAGVSYLVRVGAWQGAVGTFYLTVDAPGLGNDECFGAVPVALGTNGPYSSAGATTGSGYATCGGGGFGDSWFVFSASTGGTAHVDVCGAAFDTILSAYFGCGGPEVACNDDDCVLSSRIAFAVVPGAEYRLRLAGFTPSDAGVFTIAVSVTHDVPVLTMSQPFGSGSLAILNSNGVAGASYFTALSADVANGSQPGGGIWGGMHIAVEDLIAQFFTGAPPFLGTLDAVGGSAFVLPAGFLPPIGVDLWGVTSTYDPATFIPFGYSPVVAVTLN